MTEPGDVLDDLAQVSFVVMAKLSQVAAAHELSLTQLRVLGILRDRTPKMAELATHLGLDRSSVSGLIDRAAKRGLVSRQANREDGRSVRVALTPEGQALARELTAEVAALLAPLTADFGAADRNRLGVLLSRMLA
ncbi:MarR family transcriptional regulator [Amycolatopsis sp. OK19-0408]|uniref:MarR family transcriptional regulator n=1 Tax=Amycolatopsis iheyensis TaxID=2945988 RepID=A0A9X2SNL5_9PSEU|nr:MarR family transcriptional regulator [Amycolatopsis iheyensis]MCR6489157.1 MarR family transcriptional regulator [Amycolatopsis iheyensis]